jgi:PKD repeat protein
MIDRSVGTITQWEWDFGDGASCIYYREPDVGETSTCDAASPTHTYAPLADTLPADRIYGVTLTVTGQGTPTDPEATLTTTKQDQVRIFLLDPSFEGQSAGPIAEPWQNLRPENPLQPADHTTANGVDTGMPTAGSRWAVLTGEGTDGTQDVADIDNGIAQDFIYANDKPVLHFDFALLYDEPPNAVSADAFVATVSDGTSPVEEIPSSLMDVTTPIVGESQKFPGQSPPMVVSLLGTGSIDLTGLFPGKPSDEAHTLTFRVTNGGNNPLRSPRAYVDNIRFTALSDDPLAVVFEFDDPVAVGDSIEFRNETCGGNTDNTPLCTTGTSWRWDFDTHGTIATPAATGSTEVSPTYTFPATGTYRVTLEGFRAELTDDFFVDVTVVEATVADFDYTPQPGPEDPPLQAPVTLTFTDESSSGDPIDSWIWDFAGWGGWDGPTPDPITIETPGTYEMKLVIETELGLTDIHTVLIEVE